MVLRFLIDPFKRIYSGLAWYMSAGRLPNSQYYALCATTAFRKLSKLSHDFLDIFLSFKNRFLKAEKCWIFHQFVFQPCRSNGKRRQENELLQISRQEGPRVLFRNLIQLMLI